MKIGDKVTTRIDKAAYYSGYAGLPVQRFTPGMVGVIGAIDVPPVRGNRSNFCCIDFTASGRAWRVALYPKEIKHVTERSVKYKKDLQ